MQAVLSRHEGEPPWLSAWIYRRSRTTITGGEYGKRRLNLLTEIFQPTTLRLLQDAGLRHGLATDQEIDSILTGVYSCVQDPATLGALPRIVHSWGTA
jgi:hypothetical protein